MCRWWRAGAEAVAVVTWSGRSLSGPGAAPSSLPPDTVELSATDLKQWSPPVSSRVRNCVRSGSHRWLRAAHNTQPETFSLATVTRNNWEGDNPWRRCLAAPQTQLVSWHHQLWSLNCCGEAWTSAYSPSQSSYLVKLHHQSGGNRKHRKLWGPAGTCRHLALGRITSKLEILDYYF